MNAFKKCPSVDRDTGGGLRAALHIEIAQDEAADLVEEQRVEQLNKSWIPKPGDECWFIKSMSRCVVEVDHNDGTYAVRKLNGKGLIAARAGLIPAGALPSALLNQSPS